MNWNKLAQELFGPDHQILQRGDFLSGTARIDGHTVAVVGTTNHAPIGVEIALEQARVVLDIVRDHPKRTIVLFVDTQGQQLLRRDELLGINRGMAHLGMCIDLARRRGHRIIGVVYDQALSGGFITSGLMADACYALAHAEIRVMRLPAMARVTKTDEARLAELSMSNPVFAPGAANYVAMGGVQALWTESNLRAQFEHALLTATSEDLRMREGALRGGRTHAARVVDAVLAA